MTPLSLQPTLFATLALFLMNTLPQRIRGFTSMRYINRLFTYLLTYFSDPSGGKLATRQLSTAQKYTISCRIVSQTRLATDSRSAV